MRWRLFALLGLPSCVPASAPDDGGDAPIIEVGPVAMSSEPEQPPPEQPSDSGPFGACERDHYREWVCGNTTRARLGGKDNPYATCPATSDRIVRRATVPLGPPHDHDVDPLPLDVRLTTAYREREAKRAQRRPPPGREGERDLCCYSSCRAAEVRTVADPKPSGYDEITRCINAMNDTSAPSDRKARCPAAIALDEGPGGAYAAPFYDQMTTYYGQSMQNTAAFAELQLCCYRSIRKQTDRPHRTPIIVPGRPLRDGGRTHRRAASVPRADWSTPIAARDNADHWRASAAYEHASVASFARLSLQLLSLGAPPDLVEDTHRAAQDEIRHAALSYGIAAASSPAHGPGPLPLATLALGDIDTLAVECLLDGCIGETVAALDAHHAADTAGGHRLAAIHRGIAQDEERHAALAFRIIAWCLQQAPSTKHALRAALADIDDGSGVHREALTRVVRPCLEALLVDG